MGRVPCCSKEQGLNRGAWTSMEDKILTDYIKTYGEGKWRNIPKKAGLNRCGKSCRLRWLNYLRPDIKRGNISHDEEELIIRLHKLLGNRWSLIAGRLPGRTDNEIKNYWNTIISKKIDNRSSSVSQLNTDPAINQSSTENPQRIPNDQNHNRNDMKSAVQSTTLSLEPSLSDPLSMLNNYEQNNDVIAPFANFIVDFEVDREFLSDILDVAEFSQLVASNPNTFCCSNSDQKGVTPLLLDQQCDFQSMASIVGTDDKLGWIGFIGTNY